MPANVRETMRITGSPIFGQRIRPQVVRHHLVILGISLAIVVLALALEVRPDQRVAFPFLSDFPLPEACLSKRWLGWNCPGCGLTRSLIHLAHGRPRESFAAHHVGWMMAAAVLIQFPYRILALRRGQAAPLGDRLPLAFAVTLAAALIVNWLLGLAGRWL